MKIKLIVIAVIAFTAFSCNSTKQSHENMLTEKESTTLTETSWELSKLEDKIIEQSQLNGDKISFTLNGTDNTITGYSGCNFFKGTYTVTDNGIISFSPLASTRKACPDAIINASHLFKVFNLAHNFTLSGDTLTLETTKKAVLAVFTSSKIVHNPITEKYWKLKTLQGKAVVMAENQEREIYFTLKTEEHRIQGFAGCNTFSGSYTLEKGNKISFKHLATTLKMCQDVAVNETDVLSVFNTANNYTITGDTLILNSGDKISLAVFEAIYF
ncbi:META domain-containing protein [Bizionia gelidisalsuginis]|uniref:META domain-containing protein n=1 Tax=Bizionia gelidisalsuginis TaxID=291188 RepID=A0ABY3M812_9FLAO|nr:META domain-containing protein [Bizionia gelidisalsuginis]TYC09667.1 META domain-containing protein [Bizionia gelidisalsuginis]